MSGRNSIPRRPKRLAALSLALLQSPTSPAPRI